MASLQLSVATLEEEKNLLQAEMLSLSAKESMLVADVERMKKEAEQQAEKLRKKQEM